MDTTQLSLKETKEYAKKTSILLSNRWKHRRRMAYIALLSILAVTYIIFYKLSIPKLKVLSDVINWFYITMGSIVGAYMGFATLDDKWKDSKKDE